MTYMAPELFENAGKDATGELGKTEFYQSCDAWSFGLTLYEMAMLKPAFTYSPKLPGDFERLKQAVLNREFEPLDNYYDEDVNNFILSFLDKDPEKRPRFCPSYNH